MDRVERWKSLKNKLKSAVFIEIVIWIAVIGLLFGSGYTVFYHKFIKPNLYTITFNDIDGLIAGSPVRFMGIVVGHVRNLNYNKDSIDVQIIVTKKHTKIPQGSIASVEFSGIAGSKSIEIRPPENDLADIGIVAKNTLRLRDVLEAYQYIGKAFANLKDFVDGMNQDTVYKVFAAITKTKDNTEAFGRSLDDTQKEHLRFDDRMQNVIKGQQKLDKTLDKMNENTKKLNSYFKN